jgi:hypothetical protein
VEEVTTTTAMTNARDLTKQLAELLRREHAAMADFLVALADFDRRRLWVELGHSSLFHFLHRELRLSKGAAHYRKVAAELVQRFPEVVEPLRDGRLCVTSVVHLAKVLTPENRRVMLPRFFQCSRREAMAVAAALVPAEAAPRREVVTAVRTAPAVALPAAVRNPPAPARVDAVQPAELRLPAPAAAPNVMSGPIPPSPIRRDSADPVTADLSRLHVTVSRRFLEKLGRAKHALSHSRPGASAEEILEAGLDLVLEQQAKRRGLVEKPRNVSRAAKSDRIPAQVRRAVWTRDEGRCQWPLDPGGICGSTLRLELDHVVPRARGGPSTIENLRVLCRFHNDLAARQQLGDAWMDQFSRTSGAKPPLASPRPP